MIGKRPLQMALVTPIGLAALLLAEPVLACSVCAGGDPNSLMNQGVRAGMLFLLGGVGLVLTGLASLFLFWRRRAARLTPRVE